ncbi:hypothetical protein [Terrabacter carboxydivorans]|uniref:FtsK domain-containing protein n=1 Tax=Terrabacter carboxydivorans TaxID=619730 RepID=A0ABP5ZDQ1_9MICO
MNTEAAPLASVAPTAVLRVPVHVAAIVWGVAVWSWRHTRWAAGVAAVGFLVRLVPGGQSAAVGILALGWLVPGLVAVVWARWWPASFERVVSVPFARFSWARWARRRWPHLARECGLSVQRDGRPTRSALVLRAASPRTAPALSKVWVHPRLCSTTARGVTLTLTVRARTGQTVEDLEKAGPALAAAAGARSFRFKALSPSTVEYVLVMADRLAATRNAQVPRDVLVDAVPVGRRQDGTPWVLPLVGRHTLAVGCSGSGKGSIFWGVCGGLAPAVRAGMVRLWGVDLKRGVEVGMGRHLFAQVATTPAQAVDVLTALLRVIDERGHRMAGHARLHTPTPSDPLHVLAIDELAVLTAYTDPDTRKEAGRLLAEVLTQGRALGVVVLACVQDPRKEVIGLRGLFTQTIALRLRSADETRMVLGDGAATAAPAHRISPSTPGTAWVIEEDGTADQVRADFWPDQLVREVAILHPAPVAEDPAPDVEVSPVDAAKSVVAPLIDRAGVHPASSTVPAGSRARKPRAPRKPRQPRPATSPDGSATGGEAA